MEVLFSFLIASVLLTLSPGPDLLMVIGQSIENGLRAALIFILGLMTGLCGHTLLLVVGWAQFVGEQPQIISIMKGIGFVYFSFLGWKSIRKHYRFRFIESEILPPPKKHYVQGLLMNLINPKVSLFFWLFFPGFLFNNNQPIAFQYAVLGGLFLLQAFLVFSVVAYFSSTVKSFFNRYPMGLINGVLWIGLGVYLLFG